MIRTHVLKCSRKESHNPVCDIGFKLLGSNHRSAFKRKISGTLFIKQLKPTFNVKENRFSFPFITDFINTAKSLVLSN